jgi:hypothetical protein
MHTENCTTAAATRGERTNGWLALRPADSPPGVGKEVGVIGSTNTPTLGAGGTR